MSETPTDQTPPTDESSETPAETPAEEAAPEGEAPAEETPKPEGDEAPEADKKDDLPEWAQKELTDVRAEAANYRVRLRDAEKKLEAAKTVEEFESAVAELKAENDRLAREALVSSVARSYELPAELAEVLQGSNEDELKAHAEKLKQFAPKKRVVTNVDGGLSPDAGAEQFDPVAAAREAKQHRWA